MMQFDEWTIQRDSRDRANLPLMYGRVPRRPDTGIVASGPNVAAVFTNDSFEVFADQLDNRPTAVRESAVLLSEDERKRAGRFAFDRDRCRFVLSRAGLRKHLAKRIGIRPELVELEYGPNGKPALARNFLNEDLHFNVSHADDVAVYAFSHGCKVGVDVEAVRAMPDIDDIANYCFSDIESEAYRCLGSADKLEGFFNCWTRKEAFVKALGDGLGHPFDSFDVSLTPGDAARILRVESISGSHCGWQLYSFVPVPGYVGAVVVECPSHSASFRPRDGANLQIGRR